MFVKQKRKNECGPVALINLGKQLGLNHSYCRYIKRYRTLCKCEKNSSETLSEDFGVAINFIFGWIGDIEFVDKPSLDALDKAVDNFSGVVLKFRQPDNDSGHYALVRRGWGGSKSFTVVNYRKGDKTLKDKDMEEIFDYKNGSHIKMWVVKSLLDG